MLLFLVGVLCVVGSLVQCNDTLEWEDAGWNLPGGRFKITDESELNKLKGKYTTSLVELSASNDKYPKFEFLEIISANYRVTAGTIYDAYVNLKENDKTSKCLLSLWEKNWINFKKLDVTCGEEEPKRTYQLLVGQEKRKRRFALGGLSDVTPAELNDLNAILEESVGQVNQEHNTQYKVVRVIKAQKQVVAGTKYHVSTELTSSSSGRNEVCTIEIWEKLWENNFRQTDVTCMEKVYRVVKNPPAV